MRRTALITKHYETELYKFITGTLQNKNHKMISINGTEDHVHMLIGLNPDQSISSLMQDIKEVPLDGLMKTIYRLESSSGR